MNGSVDAEIDKANRRIIFAVSTTILVVAVHLASWGSHSLEIRWLQLRDLTGMASTTSMDRMVQICTELKKHSCVEYAFIRMAQIDRSKTNELAEYQMSRRKFKEAAQNLKAYLGTTKKDSRALLLFARAQGELGRIDEAVVYYEKALQMQAHVLQPEVVRNYVKDLARAKRYSQAQAVIIRARRVSAGNSRFMEQEYRLLDATNGRQTASTSGR